MIPHQRIESLLRRASLSEVEIRLYLFVLDHSSCSVSDAYRALKFSKSTVYRAFEKLSSLGVVTSQSSGWETKLHANSLSGLIRNLENEQRKNGRLISTLKAMESCNAFSSSSRVSGLETLNAEETIERYIDLSEMKWSSMLGFGSWEDFNDRRNIISTERQFINNRMKQGGKAFVVVTKDGPATREFIDYSNDVDKKEDRVSKKIDLAQKPIWINVFDANSYVHLWNLDGKGDITSTFIESAPLAEFYRNFIYRQLAS